MNMDKRPEATQLLYRINRQAVHFGCKVKIEMVRHKAGAWPFVRIADARPGLNNGILLLTTGIHGTEVVGPFTIRDRFAEILACARVAGLQLILYPLVNSSGWDKDTDLNIDGDGGDAECNNNFLSYRLPDGTWIWKLPDNYDGPWWWEWSSDPAVGQRLPAEIALMHQFLKEEDWPNVKITLDIHQDNLTPGAPAGAYQYPFGDVSRYNGIIEQIRPLVTILGNYDFRFNRNDPNDVARSDHNGCITNFHDGSLSDLAHRIGVPHALTIETTGATPLQTAIEVNMTWIRGLCKLASNP